MPMDAVFLHGLTQELTQSLTGARIDKVQQPERDLLLLSVRTQSGNAKLLVHGGVGSARKHTSRHSRGDTPENRPSSHLSSVAAVTGPESSCVRCSGVVSNRTGLSWRSGRR